MEYNKNDKSMDIINEKEMQKQLDKFLQLISKLEERNMKTFVIDNKKLLLKEFIYINQVLNKYFKEKELFKSKTEKENKYYIFSYIKRKRPLYIIKTYKNFEGMEHIKKYNKVISKRKNSISNYFILVCFCLFLKVISSKEDKKTIILIYKLIKQLSSYVGKLFLEEIIDINYFELMIKILLAFVNKNSLSSFEEDMDQKNEICNFIFFKFSIILIKDTFEKILLSQRKFTERQNKLINDIIMFIQKNIISYSEFHAIKKIYNNIHFLSKNDYYTTKLIDLYQIVLNTNSESIIQNYFELLSNIYAFSFEYKNIMRPLLKQTEPLFVDLNKKNLDRINYELHISNFSLSLINSLINKETKLASEETCKIYEGFYLNNPKSGLVGNLKSLENDFTIIFSIKLDKENEEEITLFTLFTNFEKNNYFKFILREKFNNPNSYDLFCEQNLDKSKTDDLKSTITKEMNYIFSVTVKSEGLFRNTINTVILKEAGFNNGFSIKTKNFKKDNIKIAFGCNLNRSNNTIESKFKGFIGDIIVFNSKNYKAVDSKNNFEGDFIVNLKGEYKNIIDLLIEKENQENNIFINKKQNEETNEKLNNIDIEKCINLDNIKLIISPDYFKLINYYDDIDYLNIPNNLLNNKTSDEYFIKRKYLDIKLKSEPNDNDKNIIIYKSFFDNSFHPYKNYSTLNEFIKYDGINFLSLLMEYYYQILNNIYEKKMMKDTQEIKDVCKKVENKIMENLQFMNENILQKNKYLNISFDDISKYFYQLSITIIKFIEIEEISFDTIKYILDIIETINNNEKINIINQLKLNLIIFLLNPNLFKREEVNIETLYSTLERLLKLIKENIQNDNFKKIMICEDYFTQLFLLLWIFDKFNIQENDNDCKSQELLNNIRKIFTELLTESFKILIIKNEVLELLPCSVIRPKYSKKNSITNEEIIRQRKAKEREIERNNKNEIINLVFEKLGEYKDNTNIFCIVLDIIRNLNLTQNADMSRIIKILKKIVEYKNREEKNTKNKILNTCIVYLFQIYLVDKEDENINEKYFHSFIRKLGMNLDVIYSLIAAMNLLKIGNINKGEKTQMKTDKFDEVLLTLNLNELTDKNVEEIHIIKSIFEDIAYILINCGENSSKELLDVLEKNVDEIFNPVKETKNLFFKEFFSSDTKICAELYYFKWKSAQNKEFFLDNFLKKYNILLSIYPNPFFFKFYELLFKEVPDESNDETNNKNKLQLLSGILNYLNTFYNNNKDENDISLINNLYNFVILLNIEYEKNNSLIFKNSTFQNIFFTAVSLLDKTGVLYSNYYIELGDGKGKLVGEIIYDIYFNITDYSFDINKFNNIFVKKNEKTKEIFTIFYFMDICKEKFFEKDKKTKEEIKFFIPHYEKILFIRNYLKNNKVKLFQGKNLHKIEHVNLSIYFIAKSFVYYKKKNLNKNFSELLMQRFLPWLSDDIYNLYTQKSRFYGNELCKSFPLYYFVKSFIETNIIPDKNFNKYFGYIDNEMPMELKDENNLESCYSSRLAKSKKGTKKKNSFDEDEFEIETINEPIDNNNNINNNNVIKKKAGSVILDNNNIISNISNNYNNSKNLGAYGTEGKGLDTSNNDSKLSNEKSYDDSSLNFILSTEKPVFNTFSNFKNTRNIILNGKKYFLRNIFSESFNDLLYNDNNFKKLKLTFLLKHRNYKNVDIDTKQLNYPITQKNFSNSVEPKIFLKRDSTFYNQYYLKISHDYFKFNSAVIFKKLETIDFYPHIFKFDDKNIKCKSLVCELVNLNYISFGKLYFFEDHIIFKSEEDPRDNQKMDIDLFVKYGITMKSNDIPNKNKFILLFSDNISEIIQRRTLLINNSIEIFMNNGTSYFFNFFRTKNAEQAYKYIEQMNNYLENINRKKFKFCTNFNIEDIKLLVNSFKKGKISNSEYLMKLNKYATRTYNDSSQYPIFPWILKQYDTMQEAIKKIFNREGTNQKELLSYFRDMNYPLRAQTEKDREELKENCNQEEEEFVVHFNKHYSNSASVYYYLMRLNPFIRLIIKLQGGKLDLPDRTFNIFSETEKILESQEENRELIPDFFCYFDFLLNLNCDLFGNYSKEFLIDDFNLMVKTNSSIYINRISSIVTTLINNNRIMNNAFVSKILNNWVDIIFGVKQLPKNKKELIDCCNIFAKTSYEQETNIEKELEPYEEQIQLNQKNVEEEKEIMNKINLILIRVLTMGVCPKQILDENISYDGRVKSYESYFKNYKFQEDKLFYFNCINDDNYILFKDTKKNKIKTRVAIISDSNKILKEKENIAYNFKSMNLMKEKNGLKNIQLYQYKYSFTYLNLLIKKSTILVVLSCRYFGNFFRLQCQDKIINIFCEDFVTTIKERSIYENDNIFYTGLINGKLTEWEIIPHLDTETKNKKKAIKCMYNFEIKEVKHIYAHKSSISIIEVYPKQKIIITSGEDKFIYIRKAIDFELLTAIDLTYSFGNPVISKYLNIFPSLIKVSELNLLYVLIYDYDKQKTFIRGYNLNGIFFAQTNQEEFKNNNNEDLLFNHFSFTKYSNLIAGFYNSNNVYVLNGGTLTPIWDSELEEKEEGKKEKKEKTKDVKKEIGSKLLEFNPSNGDVYMLKESEIIISTIKEKSKLKELESL